MHSMINLAREWLRKISVPLGVFALTRAGLFILAYMSLVLVPVNTSAPYQTYRIYPHNLFLDGLVRWDGKNLAEIAQRGYGDISGARQAGAWRRTVHFPLYPFSMRLVNKIVPDVYVSGLLISNLAFLLSLIILYNLVCMHYDKEVATRAIVLLAVTPGTVFLSVVLTEPLFLLCALSAFWFGEKKRWSLAGLAAAGASATQAVGALVTLGLLVLYLEQIEFDWKRVRPNILWTSLGFLGTPSYMFLLYLRYGDPFEFVKASGGVTAGIGAVVPAIKSALSLQAIMTGRYPLYLLIWLGYFLVSLPLLVLAWNRPRRAYAVWGMAHVLVSFPIWNLCMIRHAVVVFPMAIILALLLRKKVLYYGYLYISILMLALQLLQWSHWY